jgi:aryl-alcohol dehydrogenase-like predicted oxidoreductase
MIGFGAWAIGGESWDWGWGSQEDANSLSTIHQVLEAGINCFEPLRIMGWAILKSWWEKHLRANEIKCSWLPSVAWSGTIRAMARFSMTAAIVGARHPGQITEITPAGDWILSADDVAEIDQLLEERDMKLRV